MGTLLNTNKKSEPKRSLRILLFLLFVITDNSYSQSTRFGFEVSFGGFSFKEKPKPFIKDYYSKELDTTININEIEKLPFNFNISIKQQIYRRNYLKIGSGIGGFQFNYKNLAFLDNTYGGKDTIHCYNNNLYLAFQIEYQRNMLFNRKIDGATSFFDGFLGVGIQYNMKLIENIEYTNYQNNNLNIFNNELNLKNKITTIYANVMLDFNVAGVGFRFETYPFGLLEKSNDFAYGWRFNVFIIIAEKQHYFNRKQKTFKWNEKTKKHYYDTK